MQERLLDTGKELFQEVTRDDCPGLAAEMAFHLVLASAPTLIFILTLFGLLGHQQDIINQLTDYASGVLPREGLILLRSLITTVVQGSTGSLAILGFIGAIWAASNGATIIIKALRRAYDVNENDPSQKLSFVRQKFLSLLVVLSLGFAVFLASNLLIFGNVIFDYLTHWFGSGVVLLLNITRWAIIIALMVVFSAYIYRVVPGYPGKKVEWRITFLGAALFVVSWLILSLAFSFYVEQFGSYNKVYGAIGAVIVMMLWLYFSSLAFLAGGELNAILEGYREQKQLHRAGSSRSIQT